MKYELRNLENQAVLITEGISGIGMAGAKSSNISKFRL